MRFLRVLCVPTLGLVLCFAADLRGTQIAYEGFNYTTPGGLVGKNGGSGFGANAWASVSGQTDPALAAASLDYTSGANSIATEGNKVAPANTSRATRNFDAAEPVANRTLWVSFRINYTGALPLPTNHAGVSLFSAANGGGSELFLGKPGSATNWGVDTSTQTAVQASGAITAATVDAFLLTRITYGASTATVDMWVNPALVESSLGTAPIQSTETNFDLVSMRVSTGTNASNFQFDEIRIADTFAEVVPEPTAAAMLVGAAVLLAGRRRATIRG